jgi:hypothetical protein
VDDGPWRTQRGTRGNTVAVVGRLVAHILSTLFSWNELYLNCKKFQSEIGFENKGAVFVEQQKLFGR